MLKALKTPLGEHISKVNTPPDELKCRSDCSQAARTIYPDLDTVYAVQFADHSTILSPCSEAINFVVLGPTGSGKSSLINTIFNKKVANVKASPLSVTKHMDIYSGSFWSPCDSSTRNLNVIDSVGFCDSVMPPGEVVDIVKGFIKANVMHLHKVIIVCSNRIEAEQARAITTFMKWLKYQDHMPNFVFIYNKAEHMDDAERDVAVSEMCGLIGAKANFAVHVRRVDLADDVRITYSVAVGFPPRAPLMQVYGDLMALYNALFLFRNDHEKLTVDASACSIL